MKYINWIIPSLITSSLLAPVCSIAAGEDDFKVSGSLHAKTELFTYNYDDSTSFLAQDAGDPTNNTLTSFEVFVNGTKQISPQTRISLTLPASSIPYPALRNDLVRAFGSWESEDRRWQIDLGRFATPFSLESDEVARMSFANHGLLWGEIASDANATYLPEIVAPRGHTGVKLGTEWIADFLRTEIIYACPEPFGGVRIAGRGNLELGVRTELKFSDSSKWTLGILHSNSTIRESRQLLHAGGSFRLASTDLNTELLWVSEKLTGLARVQDHGIAIRSATPLTDHLGLGARVELTGSQMLASAAINQKISNAFDIRYQLSGTALSVASESKTYDSYELGISGSFRF